MFIIYDLTGKITGTISGPGREYGDVLTREGRDWLFYEGATTLDIHSSHVDTATKQVVENKPIILTVDKQQFYANDIDCAVIEGIPLGSSMTIMWDDKPLSHFLANDDKLEFTSDQVAEYKIFVACPKYIPTSITLKAIAPVPLGEGHSMNVPDYSKIGK